MTYIQEIQAQHSITLGLVATRMLRSRSLLHSQAQGESINEQADPGPNSTVRRGTLNSDSDELQDEVADINDFLDTGSQCSKATSEDLHFYTPCASLLDCPIETTTACYPEQYITEWLPYERLAVFSMIEFKRTATTRIDRYFVLFAQSSRHWKRVVVTATATATCTSEYKASQVSSLFFEKSHHVLPGEVGPQLEAMLDNARLYPSVTHVSINLQSSRTRTTILNPDRSRIKEYETVPFLFDTSMYLDELKQRGICPYEESRVAVCYRKCTNLYVVSVENQICLERKLTFTGTELAARNQVDTFISDMKLLLLAQGCAGVSKLVGVVVDDSRTQLRGCLIRYPEQGLFNELNEMNLAYAPISWERRARYIRQIITAVADIHKRGVVVGYILLQNMGLNSFDEIMILSFKSTAASLPNRGGYLPPEHRGSLEIWNPATDQIPTFQTDIFQLGLAIWMLAENVNHASGVFCQKNGCQSFPRYQCVADHINPVELPRCDGEIPTFVNDLVYHCRQAQPSQRKSALELLAMLPVDDSDPIIQLPRKFSPWRQFCKTVFCDECARVMYENFWHCSICRAGDFDLCPRCLSNGVSCYDMSHTLSLRVLRNGRLVNETTQSH